MRIEHAQRTGLDLNQPEIALIARDRPLPLSYAQGRMWFLDQLDPGGLAYHIPESLQIRGPLNPNTLERSFAEIVARHEPLRTRFDERDGEPVQIIDPPGGQELTFIDLSGLATEQAHEYAQRLNEAAAAIAFDLATGPLIRLNLIRVEAAAHIISLVMHHIISDGWSMNVLTREFFALYEAFSRREPSPLEPLPIQYADYAHWQNQWLSGPVLNAQLAFWRAQLADGPEAITLPLDYPRPPSRSRRGASRNHALDRDLSARLKTLCRKKGITPFMLHLAAFSFLLARYAGQGDLQIGTPIANRNRDEIEGLIGFFVNTLVLRIRLFGLRTFSELLDRVRDVSLAAWAHQDLPFEKLVDELAPARNLERTPLFQVMFTLQKMDEPGPEPARESLEIDEVGGRAETAKFELSLGVLDYPDHFLLHLGYETDLFSEHTIQRVLRHMERLLTRAVAEPERPLAELDFLDQSERERLLSGWRQTQTAFPAPFLLHRLFEQQAARTPEAPALVMDGQSDPPMTYADLDRRASALARRLSARGFGPEHLVGLLSERCPEMVVAVLGILKSGAAYVPFDPFSPPERLALMIDDASLRLLLVQDRRRSSLAPLVPETASLAEMTEPDGLPGAASDPGLSPDHGAYLIFTSGSTGRPKGVCNSHGAICNRILWMQKEFGLGADDRILQKTPFYFDVSLWEFFWTLTAGSRMILATPGRHGDPEYLNDVIARQRITTIHFVPSLLSAFLDEADPVRCASLRRVFAGGEAFTPSLRERFYSVFGEQTAILLGNFYGPTEASIGVSYHRCRVRDPETRVPMGRPIANVTIFLLSPDGGLVPPGSPGELCITGACLARGYAGRPDRTADVFTPNPFRTDDEPESRIYKTGDLARHLADGSLFFLGPYRPPGQVTRLPHRAWRDRTSAQALLGLPRRHGPD